jgi:N-glycosylase/DNA lyase
MKERRYKDVDFIREEYAVRGKRIRERLNDFARVVPAEYFYELAYCLLTPQSSAVNADAAVAQLKHQKFFEYGGDPTPVLRRREAYIRFHNTKAKRLLTVRDQFAGIAARLAATPHGSPEADIHALRDWLLAHVNGLGRKEAAHFLRNIGYLGLAILDRHILRNLVHHGVLRTVPESLTPSKYTIIEARFMAFAAETGITMDELDLLFWSRETGEIRK